ncbi:MAG: DNA translocase FtsK 4TM domain-containing protein [Marinilabiliaceae bacterium]|nr:DNA translocase FtsK 4TM domain-containing protein [Marinilabiliaceae bacterium]
MSKKNNTKNAKFSIKEWLNSFKNVKFQFISGLTLLASSIFILIAYVSFFFTGAADKSKFDLSFWVLLTDSSIRVENWTGKIGAYLTDVFINRWFGISSISIIIIFFIVGLRLLGARILPVKKTILHSLILTIWVSITLGFVFINTIDDQYLLLGGAHGYYVSRWLISILGYIGTVIFVLITITIYLSATFDWFIPLLKQSFSKKTKSEINDNAKTNDINYTNKSEKTSEKPFENENINISPNQDLPTDNNEIINFDKTIPITDTEITFNNDDSTNNQTNKTGIIEDLEFEIAEEKNIIEDDELTSFNEELEDYDETQDLSSYIFPEISLLDDHKNNVEVSNEELLANKEKIVKTLEDFKINITSIKATIGPTVTLYEIVPAPGVRISKIQNLEDDIALSLAALGIRIIAPIPGRGTIGIEVPNSDPMVVSMRSIIKSKKFQTTKYDLPIALGKTISNETFVLDLAKAPHMLVAGATGQGKSVGLNAIITSLLYKKHPSQLKLVLVDPKKVELNIYAKIERHFLAKMPDEEDPIITDVQRVVSTLNSLTMEMDSRYDLLKKAHARNIKEYNHKFVKRQLNPEKGHRFLPYIVVIIDEFADLIMTAGKEVELPIARIAQLARAVGIHMIIATQRPSTNIITGVIKANFPTRVAFKVASMIDSRTILDSPGANQLIGRGDMLISQGSDLVRVQCAFVDTPEVEKIVDFIGEQRAYPSAFLLPEFSAGEGTSNEPGEIDLSKRDSMFEEAARIVVANQMGSTSLIQRRFSIGYNRAGRIIDQLEAAGIVGPFEGSKARQVLVADDIHLEQLLNGIK